MERELSRVSSQTSELGGELQGDRVYISQPISEGPGLRLIGRNKKMGMFRLDIKKNILMKREGSHVGDVLIKMSEWLGHCCTPPSSAPAGYKQGHAAWAGWSLASFSASLPWEKTTEVGHVDCAVRGLPWL